MSATKEKLPNYYDTRPMLGCDPEFFFRKDGQVIGSEQVLPKDGLVSKDRHGNSGTSKFIIDGVQGELNPSPNSCRGYLGNEIRACMITLQETMKAKGITADFGRTVEISKEKLMELEEESRKFGCAPSNSLYKTKAGIKIDKIDATEYLTRAAGGHIHLGFHGKTGDYKPLYDALTKDHLRTVQMLDIICGNTCVLIDRDKSNIERRKLYGRAGEFRLPKHGLEYRTLSNFWLTAAPLFSMAFGLARIAVALMSDVNRDKYFEAFTSAVNQEDIQNAINNNDFDLAMANFKAIEPLLMQVTANKTAGQSPIGPINIKNFHFFIDKINENGLEYWFKQDPITHWVAAGDTHSSGFYNYLGTVVAGKMAEEAALKAKEEEMDKAAKATAKKKTTN